ncbi:hypothetical protein GCM10026982_26390 [Nocardiopsis aegyptia]
MENASSGRTGGREFLGAVTNGGMNPDRAVLGGHHGRVLGDVDARHPWGRRVIRCGSPTRERAALVVKVARPILATT